MENIIELKDVSKAYKTKSGKIFVLKDISLEIKPGEFVSVTGYSGSGKTTLMNILGLLDLPDSGIYSFEGEKIKGLKSKKITNLRREKIGYIFQNFNLLPGLTAMENVLLPLYYKGIRGKTGKILSENALKSVGLYSRKDHKPSALSGGQKQRVAIARALVTNPKVILADEPTGNLDGKTGDEIFELLKDFNRKGGTVILITHSEKLADLCDRKVKLPTIYPDLC